MQENIYLLITRLKTSYIRFSTETVSVSVKIVLIAIVRNDCARDMNTERIKHRRLNVFIRNPNIFINPHFECHSHSHNVS